MYIILANKRHVIGGTSFGSNDRRFQAWVWKLHTFGQCFVCVCWFCFTPKGSVNPYTGLVRLPVVFENTKNPYRTHIIRVSRFLNDFSHKVWELIFDRSTRNFGHDFPGQPIPCERDRAVLKSAVWVWTEFSIENACVYDGKSFSTNLVCFENVEKSQYQQTRSVYCFVRRFSKS